MHLKRGLNHVPLCSFREPADLVATGGRRMDERASTSTRISVLEGIGPIVEADDRTLRHSAPASDADSVVHMTGTPQPWSLATPARKPRVSVVVPAMNEERNLVHAFSGMPEVFEVILVDGGSTDATVRVARELLPTVRILHQVGKGKGTALAQGFAACRGDIVMMLDADGSASAAEVPRFVDALLTGFDFAKGSRFVPGGGSADITRFRQLGNRALVLLVNALYGTSYTDLCYGMNAFWADALPHFDIDCPGFEVETQINVRLARSALRVVEVPSYEHRRVHGASNLNAFTDGFRVLKTILRERVRRNPGVIPVPARRLSSMPPRAVVTTCSTSAEMAPELPRTATPEGNSPAAQGRAISPLSSRRERGP